MKHEGLIDLHVHTSPDVRPRRHNDIDLARLARRARARAVVVKHHYFPTMGRADLAGRVVPEVAVFGGIVLNSTVGGLNPDAVATALAMGAKIVWMPTLDAAHHRAMEGTPGGIEIPHDRGSSCLLRRICRLIARSEAVLATGHIAPKAIFRVVDVAAAEGVRRILINHPEHRVTGLTFAQQEELSGIGPVRFERCYAQPLGGGRYQCNRDANIRAIETLGPESTILASDAGQVENPPWNVVWDKTIAHLVDRGIPDAAIQQMTRDNPADLLGLERQA